MSTVTRLLVLLPALAALAGLLVRTRRPAAVATAVGASSVGLVLAVVQLVGAPSTGPVHEITTIGPLPAGDLVVPLHLLADRSSALVALAVTVVGLAVQLFSVWYLADDDRYAVFAAEVSLFLAGMLLVVASADLLLTLVGWEVMGWCSYLLIGHTTSRESARRAAHKAFLVTRVADIGFLLGIVVLAHGAGSTGIPAVLEHWGSFTIATAGDSVSFASPPGALTLATIGLLVGVAGKSGLVPFHDWLPDAMEGPTPASALIHAATMVAAGTVVVARLHPLYAADPAARTVLAVLAALTMVWAAALALLQSDVKRVLAYSTLSQVAIMLSALAASGVPDDLGGPGDAALGHLVSHALFKSLLFLAVGWLSVLAGGTAVTVLRGSARDRGALTWAIGIGLASLAGVPPLVGFLSKDGVVSTVEQAIGADGWSAVVLLVALLVTVVLTAAYATRLWLLLTTAPPTLTSLAAVEAASGQEEDPEAAAPAGDAEATGAHEPRRVSLPAALVVAVLAVLTVVGGAALALLPSGLRLGWLLAVLALLLVAAGAWAVWTRSREGADVVDSLGPRTPALRLRAEAGFGVDAAYVAVGRAVVVAARVVAVLDRQVVDAGPRALATLTQVAGRRAETVHRGAPSTGLVAVVVGVVALGVAGVTLWH